MDEYTVCPYCFNNVKIELETPFAISDFDSYRQKTCNHCSKMFIYILKIQIGAYKPSSIVGDIMPGKGSPEFVELLKKCIDVHYRKNHDYANDANPFSNFDRQAEIVSWFSKPIDQAFTSVIAIKIARLAELLSNDTTPNNESIDDNFVDLVNYCGLWAAWHIRDSSLKDNREYDNEDQYLANYNKQEVKEKTPREMLSNLETVIQKEPTLNEINARYLDKQVLNKEALSNIVCNSCGKMFTNIMTIRSKDGNFCSNKCADEYEGKKATSNKI